MKTFFSKKRNYVLPLVVLLATTMGFSKFDSHAEKAMDKDSRLYDQLQLSDIGLRSEVFFKALSGWKILDDKHCIGKSNLLSIADMSQSSNSKRLYVIDLAAGRVLFNTYVAHGRNSGEEFAQNFSNKPESFQSSLGFYLTEGTYNGAHGLSMKLKGLEKGINDDAEQRGIVMHGAPYVSKEFIDQFGRLGRSQGCPAVPEDQCSPIVNSIKDGSCFFMFYPDSSYFNMSELF